MVALLGQPRDFLRAFLIGPGCMPPPHVARTAGLANGSGKDRNFPTSAPYRLCKNITVDQLSEIGPLPKRGRQPRRSTCGESLLRGHTIGWDRARLPLRAQ
jgi:hypothetical protein